MSEGSVIPILCVIRSPFSRPPVEFNHRGGVRGVPLRASPKSRRVLVDGLIWAITWLPLIAQVTGNSNDGPCRQDDVVDVAGREWFVYHGVDVRM